MVTNICRILDTYLTSRRVGVTWSSHGLAWWDLVDWNTTGIPFFGDHCLGVWIVFCWTTVINHLVTASQGIDPLETIWTSSPAIAKNVPLEISIGPWRSWSSKYRIRLPAPMSPAKIKKNRQYSVWVPKIEFARLAGRTESFSQQSLNPLYPLLGTPVQNDWFWFYTGNLLGHLQTIEWLNRPKWHNAPSSGLDP